MKIVKGYYPMYYRGSELEEAVTLWAKVMQDQDFLQIQKGLERYVQTDTKGFPPVPGQIITLAKEVRLEEIERAKKERDLLPEPETKGIPMPPELREKLEKWLKGTES